MPTTPWAYTHGYRDGSPTGFGQIGAESITNYELRIVNSQFSILNYVFVFCGLKAHYIPAQRTALGKMGRVRVLRAESPAYHYVALGWDAGLSARRVGCRCPSLPRLKAYNFDNPVQAERSAG